MDVSWGHLLPQNLCLNKFGKVPLGDATGFGPTRFVYVFSNNIITYTKHAIPSQWLTWGHMFKVDLNSESIKKNLVENMLKHFSEHQTYQ